MNIQDATLTVLYFFRPDDQNDWQRWVNKLRRRWQMVSLPTQTPIWRTDDKTHFMDVEKTQTAVIVRVSVTQPGKASSEIWQTLRQQLFQEHEALLSQTEWSAFWGCTLIYWGLWPSDTEVSDWLLEIPITHPLPHSLLGYLQCGAIWQLQETTAQRSERIYSLMAQPHQEAVINQALIYHPAFGQSEALRHQAEQVWQAGQKQTHASQWRQNFLPLLTPLPFSYNRQKLQQAFNLFQVEAIRVQTWYQQFTQLYQDYEQAILPLLTDNQENRWLDECLFQWQKKIRTVENQKEEVVFFNQLLANRLSYQTHTDWLLFWQKYQASYYPFWWGAGLTAVAWLFSRLIPAYWGNKK